MVLLALRSWSTSLMTWTCLRWTPMALYNHTLCWDSILTMNTGTTDRKWHSRRLAMSSMWPVWTQLLVASQLTPDCRDTSGQYTGIIMFEEYKQDTVSYHFFHYSVFAVSFPGLESLKTIYQSILTGHVSQGFSSQIQRNAEKLVNSALGLHQKVTSSFLPTAIKFHYIFNLRDLSNIFQVNYNPINSWS